MSIALVLISTLPHVERIFGGIDYAAIWHRRLAIAGTVLLLPHVELASNPDPTSLGKALAVPAAVGLAATAFERTPVLRWSYVVIGGVGLAFYA